MKQAFSTLCCLNSTPEEVINYAIKNNINGIEARVNEKGETFGHCTVADSEKIRKLFGNAEIAITDLALSCSIKEYNPGQIEIGKNGIDFADKIGSRAVRIFAGVHQEHFSDKVKNDIEGIKKAIWELSDYGRKKNVEIWVETHSSFSSGKAMKKLIDELQRDNIKVIWDVLHSIEYREKPEETVRILGDRIAHVHLKDGKPTWDEDTTQFIHTDLGSGTIPVQNIISALEDIGYDGYYSLEWESPWRDEIRNLYPDINDLLSSYNRFLRQGQ